MSKFQKHNLSNIQGIFEDKTGVDLQYKRHAYRRPISKAVLVAAVLAVCVVLAAFSYPLFSPLDGDALTLSAVYEGEGIVSIRVENHSDKKLQFQSQTKLFQWITGEEVESLSEDVTFDELTVEPNTVKTITVDLSKAYDMTQLEQSQAPVWYYLVLTNQNFAFGQEWKCSVNFSIQQLEQPSTEEHPIKVDPAILENIEEELRYYFEDEYYGIFAWNPMHYEYLQKAQELLMRSGKRIATPFSPGLIIEPVRDGYVIDETYPLEKQYQLDGYYDSVHDAFGKLVGFGTDHHVIKLSAYIPAYEGSQDGSHAIPIKYFITYLRSDVEGGESNAFIYGQIVSFEELEEYLVYEDDTFFCYDVTHLFYTDLRSYVEAVVASDPDYYYFDEQSWQRIENLYNYYQENLRIMSMEEWWQIRPEVSIEDHTDLEELTAIGLCGTVTSNRDMEKIVIEITASSGEPVHSCTIIPDEARYYELADAVQVSEVLKNLPDGEYSMKITVWLKDVDYMSCVTPWSCRFIAGSVE